MWGRDSAAAAQAEFSAGGKPVRAAGKPYLLGHGVDIVFVPKNLYGSLKICQESTKVLKCRTAWKELKVEMFSFRRRVLE